MKRFLSVVLVMLLLSSSAASAIDLSGMSFDELVALRDQINLAIWNCQEWQEVTVPAGVWQIGVDIPAGHWTIRPLPGTYVSVAYCDRLDDFGKSVGVGWLGWSGCLTGRGDSDATSSEPREVDLDMVSGMYFINHGAVIFTPYAGKPDLGFQ